MKCLLSYNSLSCCQLMTVLQHFSTLEKTWKSIRRISIHQKQGGSQFFAFIFDFIRKIGVNTIAFPCYAQIRV